MKNSLISIIVPVFNSETTLEKCLNSLINQSYKNIEILVIDDGSTDKSAAIIKEMIQKDKRIHYFYQNNAGVSSARNYGLSLAKGEYIGFCDSDDWIELDMYEILLENLLNEKADVSIIQLYWDKINGSSEMPFGNDNSYYVFNKDEALIELNKGKLFLGQLWNKIFRKEVIANVRFDEKIYICEDVLFLNMALNNSSTVVFQNTCKYHYIQTADSAMEREYNYKYWTRREAYLKIVEMFVKEKKVFALPYVYKAIIEGDIQIAKKMFYSKCLDKNHYMILKNDMKNAFKYLNAIKDQVDLVTKIEVKIYDTGRLAFFLYMYLLTFRKRIKRK